MLVRILLITVYVPVKFCRTSNHLLVNLIIGSIDSGLNIVVITLMAGLVSMANFNSNGS